MDKLEALIRIYLQNLISQSEFENKCNKLVAEDILLKDELKNKLIELNINSDFINNINFGKIKLISKYKFIERFTELEWATIAGFEMIIDASGLSAEEKLSRKLAINALIKKLELANEINLADTKSGDMTKILVGYGFITQDRMNEILNV